MNGSDKQSRRLPELLCPAGSPLALDAAIEGGADALYLGALGRNARMNAVNFDRDTLQSGIRRAHLYGAKVYMTLNTLTYDRELSDGVRAAAEAQNLGVDALIVADLGLAAAIHRTLPELALHASTQAGVHTAAAGMVLQSLGFSRMVVARELSMQDLSTVVRESPLEIEAFIHGALCVCHSGACLFSSLVGGRSGNRGECAQPCRLPYATPKGKSDYPLSLKDLSLARHVPRLIESGVASLKIEGRMRSAEYVLTVTRIWRRLLDEGRAANDTEMQQLSDAFSRDGFTDGYYTGKIGHGMLGVRSEQDKRAGRALTPFSGITRKLPVTLQASLIADAPATLTVQTNTPTPIAVTVTGDIPQPAISAPLDKDGVIRRLTKLGASPFAASDCTVQLDDALMLPVSALNALRRAAVEALIDRLSPSPTDAPLPDYTLPPHPSADDTSPPTRSACLTRSDQLTEAAARAFDICYLPLAVLTGIPDATLEAWRKSTEIGVTLPPVIMERERTDVAATMQALRARGIRHALIGNIGHLSLAGASDMIPDGDFRLNITNRETLAVLRAWGIRTPVLAPELTLPRIRDLGPDTRTIVYGRIPLMVLEKCVIREIADCKTCAAGQAHLTDRRGVRFPVLRAPDHRNVVYNSLPTDMSDRQSALVQANIRNYHFLFTVETPSEVDAVLREFQTGIRSISEVRRINK